MYLCTIQCSYLSYCLTYSNTFTSRYMVSEAVQQSNNIGVLVAFKLHLLCTSIPQKLLDPHERYPKSFSFTKYFFCLQLALSDYEESHEGSPITVYRGVQLSYNIVLIIHCYVPIIILLMLTWKSVLYLQFLSGINSFVIIYVLYTLLCAMVSIYIIISKINYNLNL